MTVHVESCTPGQDRAKWYIPVSTSTYWSQYNMVQVSMRIPHLYKAVCTSTYQYKLSTRHVVFQATQKESGEIK
jgi:hypothetical protein